ncbi:MAG: FAD:protein FMN transferase [Bacilli bacterium]|nr:FAD:protein FMN transferase [Bacilli bacterium]
MNRLIKTLPLFLVASLTACDIAHSYPIDTLFCFDTVVTVKTLEYHGLMYSITVQKNTCDIIKGVDAISDAYKKRDVTSVYDINNTNEKIEISYDLYNLLNQSLSVKEKARYFNPLIGSLSNKWKESLNKSEVLSNSIIQEELAKIDNSSLILEREDDKYYAQRVGEALIDVGAVAKGFALDKAQKFLIHHSDPDNEYLIDAGSSSILLGNNFDHQHGFSSFKVKLKDLPNDSYLFLNNCYISTSGVSEQGVKIGDQTYSHIVNPYSGVAINNYDTVIVVTSFEDESNGLLGDALSTSFMMSSLSEIEETIKDSDIEVIVIKGNEVIYKTENIKIYG